MGSDPHAQYKHQDGPLAGQYRQTLTTLYRNVALAAHHSTRGALVKDGDDLRPLTAAEAAHELDYFKALCRQLEDRDPEVYAVWYRRYLDWKSGDLRDHLDRPDEVAAELREGGQ